MNTIRKMFLIGVTAAGLGAAAVGAMAQPAPGTGPGSGAGMMGHGGDHCMMGHGGGHHMKGHGGRHHMMGEGAGKGSPEQREARMKEYFGKRSAALHDKLKLDAGQEQGWKNYLAAITPAQRPQRPDPAASATLSAPERMEQHLALMKTHEAALSKRLDATKAFYATLTPEQQKVFNENTGHQRHGRGHRGGPRGEKGGAAGGPGAGT